jgi:signal peptidase I
MGGKIVKTACLKLTILVCITLVTIQFAFIIIPPDAIRLFNMALRPMVFGVLALAVHRFINSSKRGTRNDAYIANILAVILLSLLGISMVIISIILGVNRNIMAPNIMVVISNLWHYGLIIFLMEFIRFKLIKASNYQERRLVITLLTLSFALSKIPELRTMFDQGAVTVYIFFGSIFMSLVLSVVASYFANRGTFISVLAISFTLQMIVYTSPVLPAISILVYSLIVSGLAFMSIIVFELLNNKEKRSRHKGERRLAKYQEKPLVSYLPTAIIICVVAAFVTGMFPVYPVVVLTDSMAPALPRGNIAFVERISEGDVYDRVGEGEIIHFTNPRGTVYIHRVVDFRLDPDGQRQYITRGDATEIADPYPVTQENVLGTVRATLPFFGYPSVFIRGLFK